MEEERRKKQEEIKKYESCVCIYSVFVFMKTASYKSDYLFSFLLGNEMSA